MKRLHGALLAFALAGCGRSPESIEAERVLHSIDVLRNAPAGTVQGRLDLVLALEKEPAAGPLAKEARDRCAEAYRLLEEATALEAKIRKQLGDPDAPPPPSVVGDLAEAEAKVKQSKAEMPDCERAVAELRRAFR